MRYSSLDSQKIQKHVETAEDADWLRQQLPKHGLVAFIANGAILPRRSGVDARPLLEEAIPWQTPDSLSVQFTCPNRGVIEGTGIPVGITLIVGGGYHGKSTLLRAIELGVYNQIPGDGRELVVTDPAAVKIRAEDGRSIAGVDISPFINHLPQNRSTSHFSTANASGSTSQAANIIEALEAGAKVLLVDEDTAATNFMIRDRRMQQLIAKDKEPITPFIDKVRQLYQDYGVSTVLVMGGSGDYFDVADTVIAMENFQPDNVTESAKAIAQQYATERASEGGQQFGSITPRVPLSESIDPSRGRRAVKLKVRDVDEIAFGTQEIDLAAVEQIVDAGQLRAIAAAIVYAKHYLDRPLSAILDRVMADIDAQGLDVLSAFPQGDLAQFRRFELAAALNRLRGLQVQSLPLREAGDRHSMSQDPIFELKGVTQRFGQLSALVEINLQIYPAQRVGLIGSSGAGKSTLLRLLNGTLMPTQGEVWALGRNLARSPRQRRQVQQQIGTIYQQLHLVDSLRVIHNVNAGHLGHWSFLKAAVSLIYPLEIETAASRLETGGYSRKTL